MFVLSRTLDTDPNKYHGEIELIKGTIAETLQQIHHKGYSRLYIDGGATIQSFLYEDLIDEMIITSIPILLGGDALLFSELTKKLAFEHIEIKVFLNEIVQSHYQRKR